MSSRRGAFFDVDKTILSENSGTYYLRSLWERGEIDWRTMIQNLASFVQYKANLLDAERFAERVVRMLRGRPEQELLAESELSFGVLRRSIYPEARKMVREHQERGDLVALVSGATRYVVEPLARELEIEHVLHTRLEVREGLLTGRVVRPACFGEGKIYWLQQLIEAERIDLARSWFYTDSITDRPLLELVGHPVAVNPDPLLAREARRRRWPVRVFEAPAPQSHPRQRVALP